MRPSRSVRLVSRLRLGAMFHDAPSLLAHQMLRWFVSRWNIEVTLEELRAIERTAPCLLGVFSVMVAMAKTLHPKTLPLRETSWYHKDEATFSDALAHGRRVVPNSTPDARRASASYHDCRIACASITQDFYKCCCQPIPTCAHDVR